MWGGYRKVASGFWGRNAAPEPPAAKFTLDVTVLIYTYWGATLGACSGFWWGTVPDCDVTGAWVEGAFCRGDEPPSSALFFSIPKRNSFSSGEHKSVSKNSKSHMMMLRFHRNNRISSLTRLDFFFKNVVYCSISFRNDAHILVRHFEAILSSQ